MQGIQRDFVVVGRLKDGPILVFLVLCISLSAYAVWETVVGSNFADSIYSHLFGTFLGPIVILMGLVATISFGRMWFVRSQYLRHDGTTLYRGRDKSWPLEGIRGAKVTQNFLGIRSVRLELWSHLQPELAKAYMLKDSAESVCDLVEDLLNKANRTDH